MVRNRRHHTFLFERVLTSLKCSNIFLKELFPSFHLRNFMQCLTPLPLRLAHVLINCPYRYFSLRFQWSHYYLIEYNSVLIKMWFSERVHRFHLELYFSFRIPCVAFSNRTQHPTRWAWDDPASAFEECQKNRLLLLPGCQQGDIQRGRPGSHQRGGGGGPGMFCWKLLKFVCQGQTAPQIKMVDKV